MDRARAKRIKLLMCPQRAQKKTATWWWPR
jgi:hypothetical protein